MLGTKLSRFSDFKNLCTNNSAADFKSRSSLLSLCRSDIILLQVLALPILKNIESAELRLFKNV